MNWPWTVAALLTFNVCLYAQSSRMSWAFEVASVKPSPKMPPRMTLAEVSTLGPHGGPGSADPNLYVCRYCLLSMLILEAHQLERYQLVRPRWTDTERFDIAAKLPDNTTQEQFRLMLQDLLAVRFQLKVHQETNESQVYDLVLSSNGSKLRESAADSTAQAKSLTADGAKARGGQSPKAPAHVQMIRMPGSTCIEATRQSMTDFAKWLSNQLGTRVTDATGLTGKYDFTVTWDGSGFPNAMLPSLPQRGEANPPGDYSMSERPTTLPSFSAALQSQVGLRLDKKMGRLEVLVIDQIEKTPTEN